LRLDDGPGSPENFSASNFGAAEMRSRRGLVFHVWKSFLVTGIAAAVTHYDDFFSRNAVSMSSQKAV
jgi:hypothetical protein